MSLTLGSGSCPWDSRAARNATRRMPYDLLVTRPSVFALVRALLVVLLAASSVSMASPCADDLLVELGYGPDRCVGSAGRAADETSPEAPISVCPCACHMAIAVDGSPGVVLVMLAEKITPALAHSNLTAESPPITHPPQV